MIIKRTYFAGCIISWYHKNKRDLPWRNTRDPYLIWISEVILQQTRVSQGLGYYLRITSKYPTLIRLAGASEDSILKLWQGLGYYTRARNLLKTARYIAGNLNGVFPDEYKDLIKLKGIGKYTAAAIASFAFNKPHPVTDGNACRVIARFFGLETPVDSPSGQRKTEKLLQFLIDKRSPALFNQAIMEFGALQCKPKKPECPECCLKSRCAAYKNRSVDRIPVKSVRIKVRKRYFNYMIIRSFYQNPPGATGLLKGSSSAAGRNSFILLGKRKKNDIWKGLYDFPMIETMKKTRVKDIMKGAAWKRLFNRTPCVVKSVSKYRLHRLSHQGIYARFWHICSVKESGIISVNGFFQVPESRLGGLALPRLIDKYIKVSHCFKKKFLSLHIE